MVMDEKTYQQLHQDLEHFELKYIAICDLIKLFSHNYVEFFENENYPDEDIKTAKNCLFSLAETINELAQKGKDDIQKIQIKLENPLL